MAWIGQLLPGPQPCPCREQCRPGGVFREGRKDEAFQESRLDVRVVCPLGWNSDLHGDLLGAFHGGCGSIRLHWRPFVPGVRFCVLEVAETSGRFVIVRPGNSSVVLCGSRWFHLRRELQAIRDTPSFTQRRKNRQKRSPCPWRSLRLSVRQRLRAVDP